MSYPPHHNMSTIEMVAKANDMGSISLISLVVRHSAAPIVAQYLLEARVVFRAIRFGAEACGSWSPTPPPTNVLWSWIHVLD
jgi:hypothetical protein